MMNIGLDNGNYAYKLHSEKSFLAGCEEVYNTTDESHVLTLDGRKYLVGERRGEREFDKTVNNDMLILACAMVAEEIKDMKSTRNQVVNIGLDVEMQNAGRLAKKYENYFTDRRVRFVYEDEEYNLYFNKAKCYPQGYVVMLANYSQFKEYETVHIVDIGGGTTDIITLHGGKPDMSSRQSINAGGIELFANIRKETDPRGLILSDRSLEVACSGGTLHHLQADYIKDVCATKAQSYAKSLIGAIRERGIDTNEPITWIGGGYGLLGNYISNVPGVNTVNAFDSYANAKSCKIRLEADM